MGRTVVAVAKEVILMSAGQTRRPILRELLGPNTGYKRKHRALALSSQVCSRERPGVLR